MAESIYIRVVCGNQGCQQLNENPAIEIDFFLNEIHYVCPACQTDNKLSLGKEAKPLPRTRTGR